MRISTKLVINTVIVAVFSVLISTTLIGWMVYSCADDFLEHIATERFIALRDAKIDQIRNYYNTTAKQVLTFANDYTIVKVMHDFNSVDKKFNQIIKRHKEKFQYGDVLLADPKTGNIIYSAMKEADYTTSLINGPYATTPIGEAFKQANATLEKDFVAITDFAAYAPINNNMAAFLATPIFAEDNTKIGVLIVRILPTYINNVMTNNGQWEQSGWGKTGESYLLGHDGIMRTDSRFFVEDSAGYIKEMKKLGVDERILQLIQTKQTTIGLQSITSVGAQNVIARNTGVSFYRDYRNQPVIATYAPLNIQGLDWGIICGIDTVEAFSAATVLAKKVIQYSLIIIILISAIAIFIGFKLSKLVSVPIERLTNIIYLLAKKQDLTKRIKIDTDDELGDIAQALNTLITNLQKAFKETIESTRLIQSVANKLYTVNTDSEIPEVKIDEVPDTTKTVDNLQILSSRLESLSKQFKIFEDESDKTSGW